MGQAKNRKAEIEALKANGSKSVFHEVMKKSMLAAGYTEGQTQQVFVAEQGKPIADFTDIDEGYEDFAAALKRVGFDWTVFRHLGGTAIIHFMGGRMEDPIKLSQVAGEFPPTTVCGNGSPLSEFSVIAAFFTIIEQSVKHLQAQVKPKLCVPVLRYNGAGVLHFVVMAA